MKIPENTFFFIGGPCVIEGRDMLRKVCGGLKEICSELGIFYIFKSSFDKANRSSISSFRGPGLDEGTHMLLDIKKEFDVPVITDVHYPQQIGELPEGIDIIQIPAFLCRQTDFFIKAGKLKKTINVKKGQFMAPHEIENIVKKFRDSGGEDIYITERGSSFGYNNLVVDFRSIPIIKSFGVPYIYDATHSLQLPAGSGTESGGLRQYIPELAFAQIAAGADGLFMEVHPEIEQAKCDKATQYPLSGMKALLTKLKNLYDFRQQNLK